MIILTIKYVDVCNAGPKAVGDIINILKKKYKDKIEEKTIEVHQNYYDNNGFKSIIRKIINHMKRIIALIELNTKKDLKIIQYPVAKFFFITKLIPKKNSIAIIHDLNTLRRMDIKKEKKEIQYLNKFKILIAHNEKMKEYLVQNGISEDKIKVLELFDYLVEESEEKSEKNNNIQLDIDYVGNLAKNKSSFIYEIKNNEMKFNLNLYGQGYEKDKNQNFHINYKGTFSPDQLPNKLEGSLGLVWDGKLDETDEKNIYKNYTRYNNPHKLSCYIAAKKPVIVWKEAAVADLVQKYNIGYTISNLYDINKIDMSKYAEKKKNVEELSEKVRKGYFTQRVFDEILEDMENQNNRI